MTENAKAARDFVRACLAERLGGTDGVDTDTVILLTSELVTNAIVHAQSAFDVWVQWGAPSCVRIGVDDASPALPAPGRPTSGDTGGRGLAMVVALSHDWGVEAIPSGKRTWFEMCF